MTFTLIIESTKGSFSGYTPHNEIYSFGEVTKIHTNFY